MEKLQAIKLKLIAKFIINPIIKLIMKLIAKFDVKLIAKFHPNLIVKLKRKLIGAMGINFPDMIVNLFLHVGIPKFDREAHYQSKADRQAHRLGGR